MRLTTSRIASLVASLLATTLVAATGAAHAAEFHYTGHVVDVNDVIRIGFHLDSAATGVQVWTDSFQSGANFDPIVAVWNVSAGGTLVGQNDDNPGIRPNQTYYDSGMSLGTLAAGDYLFTIAQFPNFALGSQLAEGFQFDGIAPQAATGGTYYSVWLSGVDAATPQIAAVPEPETYALMFAGLGAVAWGARRRRATA